MNDAPAASSLRLIDGLFAGERRALARAITAVETEGDAGRAILRAIQQRLGRALVVGFTGPPGAGKSTLISAYVGELRRRRRTVAVIAVDPSSPISGGAILGDRIRMSEHDSDDGVFIRSLASRGALGGLTPAAMWATDVADAAGFDVVVLETVGAGQAEVDVAEIAEVPVVVCAPGLGDDIQAIKAGILEIARVLVVNKSDLPLADRTRRQLMSMLELRESGARVPVLAVTATNGEGIAQLADAIESAAQATTAQTRMERSRRHVRRLLADAAARFVRDHLIARDDPAFDQLCQSVAQGGIDVLTAAERLLEK
ncbi:MAG TPA: methylmalonyl Co-A mutase-associated GTPase MeaB [Xanthobacteraceae bacterium]|nr:methylmalonyl Co-A mutase-associated GTPase MeaB [Xanthobacteraceae bacterium]